MIIQICVIVMILPILTMSSGLIWNELTPNDVLYFIKRMLLTSLEINEWSNFDECHVFGFIWLMTNIIWFLPNKIPFYGKVTQKWLWSPLELQRYRSDQVNFLA